MKNGFPSKGGGGSDVLAWGGTGGAVSAVSLVRYDHGPTVVSTSGSRVCLIRAPFSGTLRKLYVSGTGQVAGRDLSFTVRVAGANTGITTTLVAPATDAQDTTNSAQVVEGQDIEIQMNIVAGVPVNFPYVATLELQKS